MRRDEFDEILEHVDFWLRDRLTRAEAYIQRADRIMLGGAGVIVAMAIALAYMAPLKQTIVEVMVLDRSTGVIEQPKRIVDVTEDLQEAWLKHYAYLFLNARESFTYDGAEEIYYTAAAFMSPELKREWEAYWALTNKESPFNKFGRDTKVKIKIISTTPFKDYRGRITRVTQRFARILVKSGIESAPENYLATYSFNIVDAPRSDRERAINPGGFQVTEYRIDRETIQPLPAKVER